MARATGGCAGLLFECDEEEQFSDTEEDEEEHVEAPDSSVSPMEEERTNPPAVRIIPIPGQPHSSYSSPRFSNTQDATVKSSGVPLTFKVNGRLIPLLPGGAELKLCSHPGGTASGFTTVQIPVTLSVFSPEGTNNINTIASVTTSSTTASPPVLPPPDTDSIPIITGVVSGEAAKRVLNSHRLNLQSSPPLTGPKTPSRASPQKSDTASHDTKSKPAPPLKVLRKGQLEPVAPPACIVCKSQYKLITELRGYMCLCSPAIASSLKNLRRRNQRRSRDKDRTSRGSRDAQTSSRVFKTRPGLATPKVLSPISKSHRTSNDLQRDQFTSTTPPFPTCSPPQDQSQPLPDPLPGKLVIMVEDFYYGSDPGQITVRSNKADLTFRCIHCPKTLGNNIKLMSHMQQHLSTMTLQQGHMENLPSCPHCFRVFPTPFKLQCHLEAVHSQYESTAKCRICELAFANEPAFLWHMKTTHKPGEMPYVCQVCDFRSSFYSEVWSHFELVHNNTKHLMCQYCLRVLRSNTCYQQHFAKHQRKRVFSCDKCRLHFLFIKERIEHNMLHHRTHIRPPQLSGLKPGTKVTVRTYSVAGGCEDENRQQQRPLCKVVDVFSLQTKEEVPKRKPVESLGPLLSSLSRESEAADVSCPSQHCIECLTSIKDFRSHFPSLVHCSLCRFMTCCSTSYANHMINTHATCLKMPQYPSIFQLEMRLPEKLRCGGCTLSTYRGDVMANHLKLRPDHHCIVTTSNEVIANDAERHKQQPDDSSCDLSTVDRGSGAFIPISLLSSCLTSPQLSVKTLLSPSPLFSPPAMTVKFQGPRRQLDLCPVCPMSASQFEAVLFSLCHGLSQASRCYKASPQTIQCWTKQQESHLSNKRWYWGTERLAEWVLSQREQQLSVSEDLLLHIARRVLGDESQMMDCYSWTVDFLLRHDLSVQPLNTDSIQLRPGQLPRTIIDNSRAFMNLLSVQIQNKAPQLVATMDEFSIFIDWDQFSNQNPSALRFSGSPGDKPTFHIVLSALSDGTFLPPVLLFKGTSSHVPEGFPNNILLVARQEGITDQDCHHTWISRVWRPHVASHWENVLIVDVHRGHLTDEFRSSLSTVSTDIFFIPSGCCCRLQPLDVCVTPVLREFLQVRWTQLVSQGGLDGLGLNQLALTLGCWLSEVSSTLNSDTEFICRSFASVCNQQEVEDRNETTRLSQALSKALVPPQELTEPPADPQPQLELLLVMEDQEVKSLSALRQVFDGESDQESFLGFQDE